MDIRHLELLEKYSSLLSIATFYFGARRHIVIWPISMLISVLNLPLYYFKGLGASFLQNIIYMAVSLYGWYSWRYRGKNYTELTAITRTSLREACFLALGLCLYVVILYPVLKHLGRTLTFLDVVRSALTMAGMWLTSHKKLETYVVWFIVNAVSIWIFYLKNMYWFQIKYVIFLCFSVYSYFLWLRQYKLQKKMG